MRIFYHKEEAPEGKGFPLDVEMPEGWHDTPAAWGYVSCPSKEQIEEKAEELPITLADLSKDELLALAEQRGIDVDKRLGVEKLRAVLDGHSA
jgi:hypothetical protein